MSGEMDDSYDEDCWNCGEVHSGPCEMSAEEEAERLDREEEERTCIGPECINPHYDHWRWECFTAESAAADYDAARAEAKEE